MYNIFTQVIPFHFFISASLPIQPNSALLELEKKLSSFTAKINCQSHEEHNSNRVVEDCNAFVNNGISSLLAPDSSLVKETLNFNTNLIEPSQTQKGKDYYHSEIWSPLQNSPPKISERFYPVDDNNSPFLLNIPSTNLKSKNSPINKLLGIICKEKELEQIKMNNNRKIVPTRKIIIDNMPVSSSSKENFKNVTDKKPLV